jgi:hypothetical protein
MMAFHSLFKKAFGLHHELDLKEDSMYGSKRKLLMKSHSHICNFFDKHILQANKLLKDVMFEKTTVRTEMWLDRH